MKTYPYPPSRPAMGDVVLIEEVPGVEPHNRWFIWKLGTGKLWNGETAEAGELWSEKNGIEIGFAEPFEP